MVQHLINLGTGKMPIPQIVDFLWNRHHLLEQTSFAATGKMPVPQIVDFLWNRHHLQQQARCLFHK
ncbi:MAG: hypothetical protein EAZ18_17330 [Oscillatoriales cyanobacterium]|nr:MAG: hypothetical protein EAZ18_17330 [Oscillatoriales cyanobacterium]